MDSQSNGSSRLESTFQRRKARAWQALRDMLLHLLIKVLNRAEEMIWKGQATCCFICLWVNCHGKDSELRRRKKSIGWLKRASLIFLWKSSRRDIQESFWFICNTVETLSLLKILTTAIWEEFSKSFMSDWDSRMILYLIGLSRGIMLKWINKLLEQVWDSETIGVIDQTPMVAPTKRRNFL